jgi:hypothetical protein
MNEFCLKINEKNIRINKEMVQIMLLTWFAIRDDGYSGGSKSI